VGPEGGWRLRFADGTLSLCPLFPAAEASGPRAPARAADELAAIEAAGPPVDDLVWDKRVGGWRGRAERYAALVLALRAAGQPLIDEARRWAPLPLPLLATRSARPYQQAALEAWVAAGKRGTVVLPTGAGKSHLAELCMQAAARPTLVVAPTLDLVSQWHARLSVAFGLEVGLLGGGQHELRPVTVSTYDSMALHIGRYGDRFGLIVWDEVHHLPAPVSLAAARCAMAPFQLGLTATLERPDGREDALVPLVGPVVYRKEITELSGDYLADYEVVRLEVALGPAERADYDAHQARFRAFVEQAGVQLGGPMGWTNFLRAAARSREGRAAHQAWLAARRIAHGNDQKIELLATLLQEEAGRRAIVFTHDNATAYRVSRALLLPCITHHTDLKERRALLEAFTAGALPTLVTSRVLNEGVDLPAAEVAIVLSGTGTVREHVQRLGRILRPMPGKRAVLYELVAAGTRELHTSDRRRSHDAYR
jgi:superfamily II DNA or RNA helicase